MSSKAMSTYADKCHTLFTRTCEIEQIAHLFICTNNQDSVLDDYPWKIVVHGTTYKMSPQVTYITINEANVS